MCQVPAEVFSEATKEMYVLSTAMAMLRALGNGNAICNDSAPTMVLPQQRYFIETFTTEEPLSLSNDGNGYNIKCGGIRQV